jgi:malonyl-CoA decarboxylase
LSPIPGFRRWLDPLLAKDEAKLLSEEETAGLIAAFPAETGTAALAGIIGKRHWWRDPGLRKAAEPVLIRLGARYLLVEAANAKRAKDPVAHFHLSNGARVERLNMAGDTSDKGAKESATLMVNYLYDPAKIEDWHEDYAGEGKRNASTVVRKLARGWS